MTRARTSRSALSGLRALAIAAVLSCAAGSLEAGGKPKSPQPAARECSVRRNGGCFDLIVDGQEALPLTTPSGTAVYNGVDYHTHTRSDQMWYLPKPVSELPKFAFRANRNSAGWFQGDACLNVIIEVANPATYHARRVADFGCNGPAGVLAEGHAVATAERNIPQQALAAGDYVVFVRAYGSVKEWDGKTLFLTVR